MHKPSNIIISVFGFFMVYGAVGTMEVDPTVSLVPLFAIACAGLVLMYTGISALTDQE